MKGTWKKSPPGLVATFDAANRGPAGSRAPEAGARPFAPGGRPMREYVVLPPGIVADKRKLGVWLKRAIAHAETLPAKTAKKPRRG